MLRNREEIHKMIKELNAPKTIWFITTLRLETDRKHTIYKDKHWDYFRLSKRTVGCYTKQEDAFEVIEKNYANLNESGYYPWAVIEGLDEGIYPYATEERQFFFRWAGKDNGKWIKCQFSREVKKYMKKYHYLETFAEIG